MVYQATQPICKLMAAVPESLPLPRQYCAGDCASPLAMEAAWRVRSAVGALRRLEATTGNNPRGSERRGEVATCATAIGCAWAVCSPQEAAQKAKKGNAARLKNK